MGRLNNESTGFSLIEVMVGVVILTLTLTSGIELYLQNMRMSKMLDQKNRAWSVAVQEMEGIKRVQFSVWLNNFKTGWYKYHFKGYDEEGNPLYGKKAIIYISDERIIDYWDKYKVENFDPMGLEEGWVYVYFSPVDTVNGERTWALNVKVVVGWRDGDVVYGSDRNMDGNCQPWWYHNWLFGGKWDRDVCVPWYNFSKTFTSPVVLEGEVSALF